MIKSWLVENRPDLLQAFRSLRHEAQSTIADLWQYTPKGHRVLSSLKNRNDLKLNIASGPEPKAGWINVDASKGADVRLDLRQPLPFSDGSTLLIFSEHFLDHIPYPTTSHKFLSECHRILVKGGRLRVVLHDGELLARKYVEKDNDFFRLAIAKPPSIEVVNFLFRYNGFHQFIYDFETLAAHLREVGFRDVVRSRFQGSEISELNLDHCGADRTVQSMYVEAIK